ncbi:MAG: HAD-IB family phosphatase [Thermoanaerobaculia bacterium]
MTAGARAPKFRLVFFDVDSTLVTIEGIDWLAGGNAKVARLTEAAMKGDVPLDQVYARRLELIRPNREKIEALGQQYIASLVDGASDTIEQLHAEGIHIHLVTAGIAQAIAPLAVRLQIPPANVHAVALRFGANGDYAGFDERSPLTRPGGKEIVVREIRASSEGRAAFIGDGVSDLEAKPVVDLFIGFGGVQVRERVQENADVFITARDLRAVVPHLLG